MFILFDKLTTDCNTFLLKNDIELAKNSTSSFKKSLSFLDMLMRHNELSGVFIHTTNLSIGDSQMK